MTYLYTSFRWATLITSIVNILSSIEYTIRYSPILNRQALVPTNFLQPTGRGLSARDTRAFRTLVCIGFGSLVISFWAEGRTITSYLAIFRKLLYKFAKWNPFAAFLAPRFNDFDVLHVFDILSKVVCQKLIQQIRRSHIIIGRFQPKRFMDAFFDIKCSFSSCAHQDHLSYNFHYTPNTVLPQYGIYLDNNQIKGEQSARNSTTY